MKRRWGVLAATALAAPLGVAIGMRPPPAAPAPELTGAWIVHRAGVPENSLTAVASAAEAGAQAIELDVRAGPNGPVGAHDADQVAGADPLTALLDRALQLGLLVELDVKTGALGDRALVDEVVALVVARDAADRVWISAFQPVAAWQVRRADPTVPLGWPIVGWAPLGEAFATWVGGECARAEVGLATPERLARWQRRGWMVELWVVAEPEAADHRSAGFATVVDPIR